MFRDKINLRLQKGGSVEPPRTPPEYGPESLQRDVGSIEAGQAMASTPFGLQQAPCKVQALQLQYNNAQPLNRLLRLYTCMHCQLLLCLSTLLIQLLIDIQTSLISYDPRTIKLLPTTLIITIQPCTYVINQLSLYFSVSTFVLPLSIRFLLLLTCLLVLHVVLILLIMILRYIGCYVYHLFKSVIFYKYIIIIM